MLLLAASNNNNGKDQFKGLCIIVCFLVQSLEVIENVSMDFAEIKYSFEKREKCNKSKGEYTLCIFLALVSCFRVLLVIYFSRINFF
jgi:hypothetical protein